MTRHELALTAATAAIASASVVFIALSAPKLASTTEPSVYAPAQAASAPPAPAARLR